MLRRRAAMGIETLLQMTLWPGAVILLLILVNRI
jgi:hypothetical protein